MTDYQVLDTEKRRTSIRSNVLGVILLMVILCSAIIALAFGYTDQRESARSFESQIGKLEEAELHRADFAWFDLSPDPYINLNGVIFNSGTKTAYNVVLTVELYDYQDVLINSHDFLLENIIGKDYEVFDFDVYCQYSPDHVLTTLQWDYIP